MTLFSKYRVNTGRQTEVDILKAFCIGWMILLHTQECLAETENLVFTISDYACTFSGAAAFMICMGLGTRYSRRLSPKEWLSRGWELLTVGQLLNLCRNALPNLIAWWISEGSSSSPTPCWWSRRTCTSSQMNSHQRK